MRLHLKFKSIHRTVIRATNELFDSRPWSGDDEHKATLFERWLRRASDAYGIPAPTLEVSDTIRSTAYDLGQITLAKYSVIELFHAFRHHMVGMGVASPPTGDESDPRHPVTIAEQDAVGWACSLFYKCRPVLFRKLVRSNKIRYVTPRDLLTAESQVAYDAEQAAAFQRRVAAMLGSSMEAEDGWVDEEDDSFEDPDDHDDIVNLGSAPEEQLDTNDRVTTQEAAALLGVSTSRVLQITDRLGGVREGRRWSFSRAACSEYLASR